MLLFWRQPESWEVGRHCHRYLIMQKRLNVLSLCSPQTLFQGFHQNTFKNPIKQRSWKCYNANSLRCFRPHNCTTLSRTHNLREVTTCQSKGQESECFISTAQNLTLSHLMPHCRAKSHHIFWGLQVQAAPSNAAHAQKHSSSSCASTNRSTSSQMSELLAWSCTYKLSRL